MGKNNGLDKDNKIQVISIGQYVKSINFENNKSKLALIGLSAVQPKVDFKLSPVRETLSDEVHRVILQVEVSSKIEEDQLFKVMLEYAGEFRLIGNIPEVLKEEILLVNCTTLLFPFVRQEVAEICIRGGHPPIMLDPIDFKSAFFSYNKQKQEQPSQEQSQPSNQFGLVN